jgi:aminoglycoside 6'-N-acetyltransferase
VEVAPPEEPTAAGTAWRDLRSLSMLAHVTIRRMTPDDLPMVDRWLRQPHVARWFLLETTASAEVEKYRRRIEDPCSATTMCTVETDAQPIGFCQWYRWEDYAAAAVCYSTHTGDVGADYAIGEPTAIGRGVGTAMIGTLVANVRLHYPRAGPVVAPEADNWASRRALEKNGFSLVDVRSIPVEPHDRPMAIYRLGPAPTRSTTPI